MYGHKLVVTILLENGAIVDLTKTDTEEHKTILELANEINDPELMKLLTMQDR